VSQDGTDALLALGREMLAELRSANETLRGMAGMGRAPWSAPRASGGTAGGPITTLPNYGKAKGAPIATASLDDLRYYLRGCERTIEDVGKAQFHARERMVKAAIEDEIKRREGAPAQQAVSYEGEDIPF
jgi:hypothetical protein